MLVGLGGKPGLDWGRFFVTAIICHLGADYTQARIAFEI